VPAGMVLAFVRARIRTSVALHAARMLLIHLALGLHECGFVVFHVLLPPSCEFFDGALCVDSRLSTEQVRKPLRSKESILIAGRDFGQLMVLALLPQTSPSPLHHLPPTVTLAMFCIACFGVLCVPLGGRFRWDASVTGEVRSCAARAR